MNRFRNPDVNTVMRVVLIFIVILFYSLTEGLRISSINIWNVMFNWDIRKIRIKEMIESADADIIALQEVRGTLSSEAGPNQLLLLQRVLKSQYRWTVFKAANRISPAQNVTQDNFLTEGVGLISRLPIIDQSVQYLLPHPRNPDKNKRAVIHASIRDKTGLVVNVLVVHLSYHRQQQCRNMAEIIRFITSRKMKNVIILGDLNTYNDYEWPVEMLLDGRLSPDSLCRGEVGLVQLADTEGYIDAWKTAHPADRGYTFSNMPSPGLESRPDRILVSKNCQIKSVHLQGNDDRYKQRYTASIHWSRFITILQSSHLSYQGMRGYPCRHDCGPHGSCQCGVCAAVGNKQDCLLPDCIQCDIKVFQKIVIHSILLLIICVHIFYAVVAILVIGGGSYGETMYTILGCNCCLMNPKLLFNSLRVHHRKNRFIFMCQKWPLFRLPPYVQLGIGLISFLAWFYWSALVFHPVIELTYNVLEEEYFPSDHLMITADIQWP